MNEFELIEEIRRGISLPDGVTGIGDDCAIIPQTSGDETLVSTDLLVEGSHFIFDEVSPFDLGWKSAAVNFSDIAAMGGEPVGALLAFSLPDKARGKWVDEFIRGFKEISSIYGFPLLGGDTTSAKDSVSICVTVLGKAPSGRAKRRDTAVPGDLVCVTGYLGDSAGGLQAVLNHWDEPELTRRHYRPTPRMSEGRELAGFEGVHAMMDISDGIGSDIRHIMQESKVGARIDVARIPISTELSEFCRKRGLDAVDLALNGGEDYELLFTVSPEVEKTLSVKHFVIGEIQTGGTLVWNGSDKDYEGFRHF